MSQLKSLVSEKIAALSLAAHRDEDGARYALELIVKPLGLKPGKNLAWNNVGKKFSTKIKDMSDEEISLILVRAPHDLVSQYVGIEITEETIPAEEEAAEGSVELPEEIRAVDEPSPALEHAIANAHATIETIEEARAAEPDPAKREEARANEPDPAKREETRAEEPRPELLMHNIELDGRNLMANWTGKGWEMGLNGKVNIVLDLPKEATHEQLAAAYKAWQKRLEAEHDRNKAVADVNRLRNGVKVVSDTVLSHLSKNVKFSDQVREARLFVAKTRDSAFAHIDTAGRGLNSKNVKELLPVDKIKSELHRAELLGSQLQAMAHLWGAKCEEKFEKASVAGLPGPKVNKPASVPAQQPPQAGGEEKKPMEEKISECKAALAALKAEFNGLSEAARKRVQKDFLKNISSIEGHLSGGRIDKALGAISGQRENLRKAVAATTPKAEPAPVTAPVVEPPTAPPSVDTTQEAEDKSMKEEFIHQAADEVAHEAITTPATEPVHNEEDVVSKPSTAKAPKGRVETQSQREERIKLRNAPTTTPATEPAKESTVTETPTTAKTTETPKVEEKKEDKKEKAPAKKWTVAGEIRCAFKNLDESVKLSFGPCPNEKELGVVIAALKAAVGGEEKALITPKGDGAMRDSLVSGMNLLVEAADAAKKAHFSAPIQGVTKEPVHLPTKLEELNGIVKGLKGQERGATEALINTISSAIEQRVTSWGVVGAESVAKTMMATLERLDDAQKWAISFNTQMLGNYGIIRNLSEGDGVYVTKGFKCSPSLDEVKAACKAQSETMSTGENDLKAIKAAVEAITTEDAYKKLLTKATLLRTQVARIETTEPGEERKLHAMKAELDRVSVIGWFIDTARIGEGDAVREGWMYTKQNAPTWSRDHNLLVDLVLSAKDGEHSLPGCGEEKRETIGRLAASTLLVFAYGYIRNGGEAIPYEWQRVCDQIKDAKLLEERVAKPGFRGYGRQLVWGLYVGTRWITLRIAGLISWAMSPVKAAYYGLKALVLYGLSTVSKEKSDEYKASAKKAWSNAGQCLKDIAMMPFNAVKNLFGKKAEENTGTSTPINPVDKKQESEMKSSFVNSLGLSGITSYSWGKDDGKVWKDQTVAQKAATVVTLPFRAVKRVVMAQKAISTGVVVGGVAAGVVGSMVVGTVGAATVGAVAVGAVVGGLVGWGLKKLFNKKSETKAPEAPKAPAAATVTAPEAPVAAPAQQAAA